MLRKLRLTTTMVGVAYYAMSGIYVAFDGLCVPDGELIEPQYFAGHGGGRWLRASCSKTRPDGSQTCRGALGDSGLNHPAHEGN